MLSEPHSPNPHRYNFACQSACSTSIRNLEHEYACEAFVRTMTKRNSAAAAAAAVTAAVAVAAAADRDDVKPSFQTRILHARYRKRLVTFRKTRLECCTIHISRTVTYVHSITLIPEGVTANINYRLKLRIVTSRCSSKP